MRVSTPELTLSSALSDPLIRTLMTADKVDHAKLENMLTGIARQVALSVPLSTGTGCSCGA